MDAVKFLENVVAAGIRKSDVGVQLPESWRYEIAWRLVDAAMIALDPRSEDDSTLSFSGRLREIRSELLESMGGDD